MPRKTTIFYTSIAVVLSVAGFPSGALSTLAQTVPARGAAPSRSADPNFPRDKGFALLAPNAAGVANIIYGYPTTEYPIIAMMGFTDGKYHGIPIYLGFNEEGSWILQRDSVYIVKGMSLRMAAVHSNAEAPGGLKNPSPIYLSEHPGVGGKKVTVKLSEDPNLPGLHGSFPLKDVPFSPQGGANTISYAYLFGADAPPVVQTERDGTAIGGVPTYLGFNDDGTWLATTPGTTAVLRDKTLFTVSALGAIVPKDLKHMNKGSIAPSVLEVEIPKEQQDANFPGVMGSVALTPNPDGAIAVNYFYFDEVNNLTPDHYYVPKISVSGIEIPTQIYFGYNDEGSWFTDGKKVRVLKGHNFKTMPIAPSAVPKGLRNPTGAYFQVTGQPCPKPK